MYIKNNYVSIQTSSNKIISKNKIYNNYFTKYALRQLGDTTYYDLSMKFLLIKFDNIMDLTEKPSDDDFDVMLAGDYNYSSTNQIISAQYTYSSLGYKNIYNNIKNFINKKITTLAFGNYTENYSEVEVFAAMDISMFNIYLLNDLVLNVSRSDSIFLDGYCDNLPIHLFPFYDGKYAKLYSVGLGSSKGLIEEEKVIGKDVNVEITEETEISPAFFTVEVEKGVDNVIYPLSNIFPAETIYPLPNAVLTIMNYPLDSMYPSDAIYPTKSDYKYVIFKYKVSDDTFYTVSFYTEKKGVFKIKNIYERID